jgi:hypothetical protein
MYLNTGTAVNKDDTDQDTPLSESHLCRLAQAIGLAWRMLGPEFGLPGPQIEQIQVDHHTSALRIFHMLRYWKNKTEYRPTLTDFRVVVDSHQHVIVNWEYIESPLRSWHVRDDDAISSRALTEADIVKLAPVFGLNWELIGPQLGVSWTHINRIKQQYPNVVEQIREMLQEWWNIDQSKATFSRLMSVLKHSPSVDVDLDFVKNVMETKDFDGTADTGSGFFVVPSGK